MTETMNYRKLGKTEFNVSEISLGTWQVGGVWGSQFDHKRAEQILRKAIDSGINFIDTADVYSGGESERAVGNILKQTSERIYVATKCGRQISPHVSKGYTPEILRKYVEDSLKRLRVDCIDIIQLHCPPTDVYYRPEIFALFDKLKSEGKILHLGVSVEKVEEGMKAIEYENVATIQVIFNIFRQRPAERLFPLAKEKNVGLIIRVPLASGLLTGKFTKTTQFGKEDHRYFNRNGESFDKGETFAGIPYEIGIDAVELLKKLFPKNVQLAHIALKWILLRDEVSCIIPGASSAEQIESNIRAGDIETLSKEQLDGIQDVYESSVKSFVHQYW
jgi:aryl-alcohol dehydrogenase-like predicted oxidoreductase